MERVYSTQFDMSVGERSTLAQARNVAYIQANYK